MSEPSKNKIVPISKAPAPDVLARLEKLEDSFLAGLQDIRAIKTEIRRRTDQTTTLEKLLDAKEVAEIIGEDERWVYRQARAKQIPAIRLGKYWKFSPSALQRWLEQQQTP